jgi:hypothetical protein
MSPTFHTLDAAQHPVRGEALRRFVAHLLRAASAALARQARTVAQPLHARQRRLVPEPIYEFHAEAGAPEGALYVDGKFVGVLEVTRL